MVIYTIVQTVSTVELHSSIIYGITVTIIATITIEKNLGTDVDITPTRIDNDERPREH